MVHDLDALTLVLATQRSGSTLLCRDIESLGGMGVPRENFLGLAEQAERESLAEPDVLARIARGATDDEPRTGAVKLMVGQAPTVDAVLRGAARPRSQQAALRHVVDWAFGRFDRVFLVVLFRNALDQAISHTVASSRGLFHATDADDVTVASDALVPEQLNPVILAQLQRFLAQRRLLAQVAEQYADRALLLTYDELTGATEQATERLLSHARAQGFTPHRDTVSRTMVKVIDTELSQRLRESFLGYLATETGLPPGTVT